MTSIQKRLAFAAIAIVLVIFAGIVGYVLLEGWPFLDAAFMTVITLATVGYGETHPLSPVGRIFTMFLILMGMGILAYGVSSITAFVVEGELTHILEKRKMEKEIAKLESHIVLCGLGQTGRHVAEELIKTKTAFVAIERDKEVIEQRKSLGPFLYVQGDASQVESLVKANIASARGLITTLASDKDNLFVVITAKELNPGLRIVTRLIEDESRSKLAKVGADAIVSSNLIGGLRMASEMIRPAVVSFLDMMLRDREKVTRVEDAQVSAQSKLVGQALRDSGIKEKTGLLVIAMRKASDQKYIYNPSGETRIDAGDWFIVYGSIDQIERLRGLASG